jgi:hypothetical protein
MISAVAMAVDDGEADKGNDDENDEDAATDQPPSCELLSP